MCGISSENEAAPESSGLSSFPQRSAILNRYGRYVHVVMDPVSKWIAKNIMEHHGTSPSEIGMIVFFPAMMTQRYDRQVA